MSRPTTQRIDGELHQKLRAFSDATGVPVARCMNEALKLWLADVAPGRLKALTLGSLTEEQKLVKGRPAKAGQSKRVN